MGGDTGEADGIVLLSLNQGGVAVPETITSIADLVSSPVTIIEIVVSCLDLIHEGDITLSKTLPSGVAKRHRVCTEIANKIKESGYTGDCGYNQLLYPDEASIKKILVFLIDKLPRVEAEELEEVLSANALLNKKIGESFAEWTRQIWTYTPSYEEDKITSFNRNDKKAFFPFKTYKLSIPSNESEEMKYNFVVDQVPSMEYLAPSIFESTALAAENAFMNDASYEDYMNEEFGKCENGVGKRTLNDFISESFKESKLSKESEKGETEKTLAELVNGISIENNDNVNVKTRFMNALEFGQEADNTVIISGPTKKKDDEEEENKKKNEDEDEDLDPAEKARRQAEEDQRQAEEEINQIQNEIDIVVSTINDLKRRKENKESTLRVLEGDISNNNTQAEEMENEYKLKKKLVDMLPQAQENISKLREICQASSQRLLDFGVEWESHRKPLIQSIRLKKGEESKKKERAKKLVDEMKSAKKEMQPLAVDIREREEKYTMLAEEYEKMPKNINRDLYTKRILDIINNINRQKKGIKDITADIHDIQKEINNVSGALERADIIADEKVFQAAQNKNDKSMVESYRLLDELRNKFLRLGDTISEIGRHDNAIRDLETKSNVLKSRLTSNDMYERIASDLAQVQIENAALKEKINSFV